MLLKLQKKTLVPAQILGYSITLFIGIAIILSTVQLFLDARPLLCKESNIFKSKAAVVSKSISILKSLNKDGIYFSPEEIETLKQQGFVKDLSLFTPATFRIKAQTPETGAMPVFYTDLFFESVSEKYLDVQPDEWIWDESSDFLPIIIPEDYLNLYNFGFAESQGLPVLSKSTVSQVEFIIKVSGNGNATEYRSKIVGFSSKINSILVPENFMAWANNKFGDQTPQKTSRILVEFNDPSDEAILQYFEENNYAINKENLEFSQLIFFFKSALVFVFVIAIVIIVLSIAFILMSVNLILQKNKELILNLYNIGYSYQRIGKFYQVVISSISLLSIVLGVVVSSIVRSVYVNGFQNFFTVNKGNNQIILLGLIIAAVLLLIYNLMVILNIKKIVLPKKGNK